MSLDRIQIAGFKSIREIDLPLRPLNVLIGANGAGKSNLIGAFGLLRQLVDGRLQAAVARGGGAATLLHHGPKHTPEGAYKRIVAAIQQVAPFFEDFQLRADPLAPDSMQLEWREKGSEAYFNAHALSDGTLRFVCLATLLLQPQPPSLVLIDEPELGLHPFAITQLAAMLQSAATRTQVLVGTQSVTLVNQLDPADIIVVDRTAGPSSFRRIEPDEVAAWADEYALGELWEKNVLGGRPQPAPRSFSA